MTEAAQTFTKEGIIEHLHKQSVCGCIDTTRLSNVLGTISPRMIRKFAFEGKLKPIDRTQNFYVFKVEDVADWLLQYPKYLFKPEVDNSDLTVQRVDELSALIRNYVRSKYSAILRYMELEDVVMEVLASICRKRHRNVSDGTLVFRAVYTLYKKVSRRVDTVSVDPHKIEQTFAGDDDDSEN